MIGLVLVSHSRALAEATRQLVLSMSGEDVPVVVAAGTGENRNELGTDAVEISEAIQSLASGEGIVVMMDMGSAVLSTETALDLLDEELRKKVKLCPWSFVEGAVVGGVVAKTGGSMEEVIREASLALNQKTEHLSEDTPTEENRNVSGHAEHLLSRKLIVPIPHGLHARPAARLVQLASGFSSDIRIRDLTNGKGPVSVKSITAVMTLEVLYGHEVELLAEGSDAAQALDTISREFIAGLGDQPVEKKDGGEETVSENRVEETKPVGVSPGIVIAPLYFPAQFSYIFPDEQIGDPDGEIEKLKTSLAVTDKVLRQKAADVSAKLGKEKGDIFRAQASMLNDPALQERATGLIREKKLPAPQAWWTAVCEVREKYKKLQDVNLRQRVSDLEDVAQLVLVQFGIKEKDRMKIPGKGIILVDDLTPGQVSSLDKEKVAGVICLENGTTSHSSILLRSRDIPAIVQARFYPQSLRNLAEGTLIVMDGETGEIRVNPQGTELISLQARREEWQKQVARQKEEIALPTVTTDGKEISILANAGDAEDVRIAVANHAAGIGLLRTEFMFLDRQQAPSEEEQVAQFLSMLEPMKGLPVVIRTLDAGGDKELPYLQMPREDNPFLGVRAIRLTLRKPELFRQQLRAILRITVQHDVRIMFPMISTLQELRKAKQALEEAHDSLQKESIPHRWPVTTGMMMEVPSAAILAHLFAPEVDFMSIGTNDLIQYTMAVDRTNSELQSSPENDFEPAVRLLLHHICDSCRKAGKPVSVCGEAAANSALAGQLIGAGVFSLSMNPSAIPTIKSWVRTQSAQEWEKKFEELLSGLSHNEQQPIPDK